MIVVYTHKKFSKSKVINDFKMKSRLKVRYQSGQSLTTVGGCIKEWKTVAGGLTRAA